jgi:CheY-like chemotaxis protein
VLLKGKRIFYVEDDLTNRSLVQLVLEQHGASMRFERWGTDDALRRLHDFAPVDLILLDLMLPDNVSGYDIFNAIREDEHFNAVPIVALSAADPSIEMSKARAYGFSGFISKPISLIDFPQQIKALIEGEVVWFAN